MAADAHAVAGAALDAVGRGQEALEEAQEECSRLQDHAFHTLAQGVRAQGNLISETHQKHRLQRRLSESQVDLQAQT